MKSKQWKKAALKAYEDILKRPVENSALLKRPKQYKQKITYIKNGKDLTLPPIILGCGYVAPDNNHPEETLLCCNKKYEQPRITFKEIEKEVPEKYDEMREEIANYLQRRFELSLSILTLEIKPPSQYPSQKMEFKTNYMDYVLWSGGK